MTRLVLILAALFFLGKFTFYYLSAHDNRLQIVVCDVGQGEGIYIRSPQGANILFDGGPDDSILTCLSKHMPFWERKIDLMLLSHPHADHYTGLVEVAKRYEIKKFITEDVRGDNDALRPLYDALAIDNSKIAYVFAGEAFRTSDGVILKVLGPTHDFYESKKHDGVVDPSDVSLQVLVSFGSFDALLTGDSNLDQMEELVTLNLPKIEMLQTPHHGSKNGLSAQVVDVLRPSWTTISVGKNNYGQPSPLILDFYKSAKINYQRTDEKGDLKLKTNGKTYNIE